MKAARVHEFENLVEQIERADKMAKFHASAKSAFMHDQYEAEKQELLAKLIENLLNEMSQSSHSVLYFIVKAIRKYYPEMASNSPNAKKNLEKDRQYKELKALESVLT